MEKTTTVSANYRRLSRFFFFTGCPDLPDKDLPKALRHIVIPFIFELYGTLPTILLPYIIIIPHQYF
jgi:hypothetical protein